MKRLLAKSYDPACFAEPPRYALLPEHIADVAVAAETLYQLSAGQALHCAGLEGYGRRMRDALLLYAYMHDQGKANNHFHEVLRLRGQFSQMMYHEAVSGMLFYVGKLRNWVAPLGQTYYDALFAVCGHHCRFRWDIKPHQGTKMVVYASHPDFARQLDLIRDHFRLPPPPPLKDMHLSYTDAMGALSKMCLDFADYTRGYQSPDRVFTGLLKAYGIAADCAASAIARKHQNGYSVDRYIRQAFSEGLTAREIRGINGGKTLRPFQIQTAQSQSNLTLLVAGCGSGKSAAAYAWAAKWSERLGRKVRLFFCLPTTGTATEHYKDYASHLGIKGNLSHCRRRIDLEQMAQETPDGDATRRLADERDKIDAMELWSTPLTVCTADTVLGLMSFQLRSVCATPAILGGVIVFDEIHSYDRQMFDHLLVFIKSFPNLPVLLMTATLPRSRHDALRAARPDINIVGGDPAFESAPRYRLEYSQELPYARVGEAVARGEKVLWVRNTVDRATATYLRCKEMFPEARVYLYHSRFQYKHRVSIHRKVIDAFNESRPVILVATQVAEMSLDLSADLLVTDLAPIWAVIQRMGRLNRVPKPCHVRTALIVGVAGPLPYSEEQIGQARQWVDSLLGKDTSQRELTDSFEETCDDVTSTLAEADRGSVFYSGVWQTRPGYTRGSSYTVSAILERDYREYVKRWGTKVSRTWLRKVEVSIPYRKDVLGWERVGPWFIAPTGAVEYDKTTGAKWVASVVR